MSISPPPGGGSVEGISDVPGLQAALDAKAAQSSLDDVQTAVSAVETAVAAISTGDIVVQVAGVVVDGTPTPLTTGVKTEFRVPFGVNITGWTILGDQAGDVVFDLWKDSYANYPPVVGDSCVASAKPAMTNAVKATSTTLTGWDTSWAAGEIVRVNVDEIDALTRVQLILHYARS